MFGQLLSFVILFLVQVNQMQLLYNGKCSSWMSSHPVRVVPITCSREAILLNLTLVIQRQIIIIKRELSFLPSINKMFQAVSYTEWKQLTLISNFFFFHVCCIFWKKSLLQHRPDCNSFKAFVIGIKFTYVLVTVCDGRLQFMEQPGPSCFKPFAPRGSPLRSKIVWS